MGGLLVLATHVIRGVQSRSYTVFTALSLSLAIGCVHAETQTMPSPEQTYPNPVGQQWIRSGTYFTAAAGYASVDWKDFKSSPFRTYNKNASGGLGYGFSVGYRFDIYPFALEGGYYRLPSITGMGVTTATPALPIKERELVSWFAYLAGKFRIQLTGHLFAFLAAGAAYREFAQNPSDEFSNPQPYYYAAILMTGFEWYFSQDWELFTQYFYVPSYTRELPPQPIKQMQAPEVHLIVLGVGYKFSI